MARQYFHDGAPRDGSRRKCIAFLFGLAVLGSPTHKIVHAQSGAMLIDDFNDPDLVSRMGDAMAWRQRSGHGRNI